MSLRKAATKALALLLQIELHELHKLQSAVTDCTDALTHALAHSTPDSDLSDDYQAGYTDGYRSGFDNGREIGFEEGSDRLLFNKITHGHFDVEPVNAEIERLRIDVERYKASAGMWRNKCYELGGTPLPWEPEELIRKAVEDERGACARVAGVALLGADKSLSDRVLNAIRARGKA